MKAIIIISSIFYILGLKISNKIDFMKRNNPVEKIIMNKIKVDKPTKSYFIKDELKTNADSLKGGGGIIDAGLQKFK